MWPADCSVCPVSRLHPRPDSAAALSPVPRQPRHPGAELLRPSGPEGTPERSGGSEEGSSWDDNTRPDVLLVKLLYRPRPPGQAGRTAESAASVGPSRSRERGRSVGATPDLDCGPSSP